MQFRFSAILQGVVRPGAVVLLFCASAFGVTLGEYRTNLSQAAKGIDEILAEISLLEQGEGDEKSIPRMVANVRRKLPSNQKIDMPGGTIEIDSDWFIAALNDFEKRPNLAEKAVILTGIKERLAAIEMRIEEKTTAAATTSKDEDKQKLGEILRREEYQKPKAAEESLIERWWREFWEWIDSLFPKPQIDPSVGGIQPLSVLFQVVLYGALIAAIGFLIYRFAPLISSRFGRRGASRKGDRVILGESIAAEASGSDLLAEADELARSGELRLAIRKGYIALLCELSDRKLIRLARHKTNRDYLRDVRKRPRLFENMTGVTGSFERHWYGFQGLDGSDWETFRASYQRTVNESQQ